MVVAKRSEQHGLLGRTFWMDVTGDGDEVEERTCMDVDMMLERD